MYASLRGGRSGLVALLLLGLPGCSKFRREHIPVARVQELGYPRCGGDASGWKTVGAGHLRSGPTHPDPTVVERFAIVDRGCTTAVTVRQEWPLGTADVEVLYDRQGIPLRVWKRMTLPGVKDPRGQADIRRYELRTTPVTIKRRVPGGQLEREQLLGGRPQVVIGPGRGLISMWIRRAKLQVGGKVRELALDVRALEKIEPVTLLRERDVFEPALGGKVQVYTFYGRETVFATEDGVVVGDLMGLRPHALLKTSPPPAIPLFGPVDPSSGP